MSGRSASRRSRRQPDPPRTRLDAERPNARSHAERGNEDSAAEYAMALEDPFTGIDQAVALPALLGYLNFSEGRPDPRFQKNVHDAFAWIAERGSPKPWGDLPAVLQ